MKQVKIGILNYPGSLKSAIYGLDEMFQLANSVLSERKLSTNFQSKILDHTQLVNLQPFTVLIIPPSINNDFYLSPTEQLLDTIKHQHAKGCILASACAGAFILAASDLLNQRTCTTHWELAPQFKQMFEKPNLQTNDILINHGDIITAGGIMSWVDFRTRTRRTTKFPRYHATPG